MGLLREGAPAQTPQAASGSPPRLRRAGEGDVGSEASSERAGPGRLREEEARDSSEAQAPKADGSFTPGPRGEAAGGRPRVAYYDFWRVTCVALIVITHADEVYAQWNVFAVQQWVLPVILLVSGALYAKSRAPLLFYVSRLMGYFSAGCLLNAGAAMLAGVRWWGPSGLGDAVMFQMAFVILFACGAIFGAPLRAQALPEASPAAARQALALYGLALAAAVVCLAAAWCFDWGSNAAKHIIKLVTYVFGSLFLAAVGLRAAPAAWRGVVGWVMLAFVFGTRMAHREVRPGLEFHFVELYVWACFVQLVPLEGQAIVGRCMVRSWPIWVIGAGGMLPAGRQCRFDREPHADFWWRLGQYTAELLVVIAFVAIPTAGPDTTVPFSTKLTRHLPWANNWALFVFISHKAVYHLTRRVPDGLVLNFLGVLPFLALHYWRSRAGRGGSEEQQRPGPRAEQLVG